MNWKSTTILLLLAAGTAVWFFKGDDWWQASSSESAHSESSKSAAVGDLESLSPSSLTHIEVAFPSGDPLLIERANLQSEWKMPGNWPLRTVEVGELVETLGNLRTRFRALKLTEGEDLSPYGLASGQKPIVVKLTAHGQSLTLTFGEPKLSADETAFTRPAFVRVNDTAEVLKLGPDVMEVVRRSADSYRRRQLFPDVERVKLAGGGVPPSPFGPPSTDAPETITIPEQETESIAVHGSVPKLFDFDFSPLVEFTLLRTGKTPEPGIATRGAEAALKPDRLADAWRLMTGTHNDPPEPGRLRGVLAAVSDLWVDDFVHTPPAEAQLGFAESGRSIQVKRKGSGSITVRFGSVAKTVDREETISVPAGPPGSPPRNMTRKIPVEYRYARIDGNPQIFIVSAEKFSDLFAAPSELADARVARFDADEVQEVVIEDSETHRPAIKLFRKKGNANAPNFEERNDRWFIEAKPNPILAETSRVNELFDRLVALRTDVPSRRTYPAMMPAAGTTVTIMAREQRAQGEPDAPTRAYQLMLGNPDAVKHLLPVWLAGQHRVSLVDDRLGSDATDSWLSSALFPETLSALFTRPALAYRSRELFDTGTQLETVTVPDGFTLKKDAGNWKLVAPVVSEADPAAANLLAENLARLAATEYLISDPTPQDLKAFGLEKPRHSIALGFANGRIYTLDIGGPRLGKPEVFAQLDRGAVFGLPNATSEQLSTGAVGLLPLRVWATQPETITSLEITRFGDRAKESFALSKEAGNWKLTGPFIAPVPNQNVLPLLSTLGNLSAVKYQALATTNDAEFGFDKPLLKLKLAFTEKKPGSMEEVPVTKTLLVGGQTPDGFNRYARLDTPKAPVFVVPPTFLTSAQVPSLELLDRSILTVQAKLLTKIAVTSPKPEDAVTLVKNGAAWKVEGAAFAVDAERSSQLAAIVANLPVSHLAAFGDAIKWGDFGLEQPEHTITISVDPEVAGGKPATITLQLGKADPSGGRFARVLGKNAVAVVPAQIVAMLTRKKFDYADRTLLSFDPTTLVGLTRTEGKDTLELVPAAAIGWDIVKPTKHKADQQFIEELTDSLGRLRAERVAAFGKKDEVFKQYGLDSTATVITVTVGEKAEQKTLRIGNPVQFVKADGDRYVAVESANPEAIVGVLPAALVNKLTAPAIAFRDHSLAKFVDADKAVLERSDRKLTFAKVGVTWKLTEPLAAPAESADLEALIADLGKLRVDTWVAEKGKDLKAFGLDKPEAKWTIFDGEKPVLVLLIGKKTADGRVNVATDKGELVGLLDVPMTVRVLAEYRLRRAWDVDAAQVDSVEIAQGVAKFTLEKAGPQWVDPAKPTDMIDVRVVTELLGTLGGLKVEEYAADKDAALKLFGLEKPEMTLTAVMRGGTAKRTLEIGAAVGGTDGKERYARVVDKDRSDVFVLSAADTARLLRDRAAYVLKK